MPSCMRRSRTGQSSVHHDASIDLRDRGTGRGGEGKAPLSTISRGRRWPQRDGKPEPSPSGASRRVSSSPDTGDTRVFRGPDYIRKGRVVPVRVQGFRVRREGSRSGPAAARRAVGMDAEDPADVAAGRPLLGLVGDRHHVHACRTFWPPRPRTVAVPLDGLDGERPRPADDEPALGPAADESDRATTPMAPPSSLRESRPLP